MPYIAMDGNRFIGQHCCGRDHKGDQSMIRMCCVNDWRTWRAIRQRVAMTDYHPAAIRETAAWNALTEAECANFADPDDDFSLPYPREYRPDWLNFFAD